MFLFLFIWCLLNWTVLRCTFLSQHQSFPQSRNSFKVGMKLEGLDPSHPSLFCVLTVAEVRVIMFVYGFDSAEDYVCLYPCLCYLSWIYAWCLFASQIQGYRVRLHFDGYPECYDFWANADSWDLKPAGWCEKNGHKLLLPKGSCKIADQTQRICEFTNKHITGYETFFVNISGNLLD